MALIAREKPPNPPRAPAPAPLDPPGARSIPGLVFIGGLLVVSFIVGFPAFCLICPIGLVFGFLFALFKSLSIYQPSWDLIVFPLILFVEFRLLRSWCSLICPVGALLGLIGHLSAKTSSRRAPA